MSEMLGFLQVHTQQAHPQHQPQPSGSSAGTGRAGQESPRSPAPSKIDKRPSPEVKGDMSEHDWRFFLSEFEDYKRATGISGQTLLDELWSCRVCGIAENCDLSEKCSKCNTDVSFLEKTVYNMALAGIYNIGMKERVLSSAIQGMIKDTASMVEFCTAEESAGQANPSHNAMQQRSGYRQGKFDDSVQGKCSFCGSQAHSNSTRDVREQECKAYSVKCNRCKKLGHFSEVCLAKKRNSRQKLKWMNCKLNRKEDLIWTD